MKLGNAQWLGGKSRDTLTTIDELRKLPERDGKDARIDLLEASAADSLADYPRAIQAGIALRLGNLSRVLALQGQLRAAETLNAEECRVQEPLRAPANLAWCRVRLADLWLELGRVDEARALIATVTVADLGTAVTAPVNIARFATVQLKAGDSKAAATTIAAAERANAGRQVLVEQTIQISTARARIDGALGNRTSALERLAQAGKDARRLGLLTWELEAMLARCELDPTEATATERSALAAGFELIANKARALGARLSTARQ